MPGLDTYNTQNQEPEVDPVITPQPVPQISKAQQLMNNLYATREVAPVPDTERANRLAKMGRINAIGQAVGVLGDMFALGQGGIVKRRAPDTTSPMLYQQYQATLDRDKAQQDAWRQRTYAQDRQNKVMGVQQAQHEEAAAQRAREEALKRTQHRNEFRANFGQRGDQITNAKEKAEKERIERERHNKVAEKIGWANVNKPTESERKLNAPVLIDTGDGVVSVRPEQVEYMKGEMLKNADALQQKYPKWFQMVPVKDADGLPTGENTYRLDPRIKNTDIAREYLINQKQAAAAQTQAATNAPMLNPQNNAAANANYNAPVNNPPVTQPKVAKKKPSYSNLTF